MVKEKSPQFSLRRFSVLVNLLGERAKDKGNRYRSIYISSTNRKFNFVITCVLSSISIRPKHTHSLPLPGSKLSHMDIQHPSGRLDQGILILALPLNFTAHLAICHAVYGLPILNGVVIGQNIGRHIVGVVYYPVGVHAMEVVLEVGQKQGAHAHCVDEHILSTLNVEESDIDAKADEPIRAFNLMGTHILRQQELAAVLEIERLTGGVQLRKGLHEVGVQVGPLQSRERRRQHIGGHHLIPTLPEDPLPVLLAVPHLAHQEGVKAFALELVAFHHHQLHRAFAILKFRDMIQGGKAGHLFITAETLYSADVLFHHSGHFILVRHVNRLFEQYLNKIGAAGLGAFFVVQVLLEHFIAHLVSSS